MGSEEFYRRFRAGELGDDIDFVEWGAFWDMHRATERRLDEMKTYIERGKNRVMQHLKKQKEQVLYGVLLTITVTIALVVRVWGNDFGLPYTYHQDDARNVERSLRLLEGTLSYDANPGWNVIMSLALIGKYVVCHLQDDCSTLDRFITQARLNPTQVEKTVRSLSGLLGAATVLIVFLIGKRAYNIETGMVGAVFLAFSFLHVRDSHYAVADIPATFLLVTTILFGVIAYQTPEPRYYLLAGLFGGFASATKWTSLAVLLPLTLILLLKGSKNQWIARIVDALLDRSTWAMVAGFVVGFLTLSPQLLFNPLQLLGDGVRRQVGLTFGGLYVDTVPGWIFYIKTLAWGIGIPLLILSGIGIGWAFYQHKPIDWLLLAFPTVYYVLMGIPLHYFARYALPLLPFLSLFGARMLVDWTKYLNHPPWLCVRKYLLASLTVLFILPSFHSIVLHNQLLTRPDTRTLAGDWFEENVPAGATVAAELHTPFFRDQVGPGGPFLPRRGEERYKIIEIGWPREDHYVLRRYTELEADYIVTSSFITNLRFVDTSRTALRQAFYHDLANQAELVAEFYPYESDAPPPQIWAQMYGPAIALDQFSNPGPVIKIYQLSR